MNRRIKRAFKRYDKDITSIVRRVAIKQLKRLEIDYTLHGDKIVSTRTKDVDRVYNSAMMQVVADFSNLNGDLNKLKQLYE